MHDDCAQLLRSLLNAFMIEATGNKYPLHLTILNTHISDDSKSIDSWSNRLFIRRQCHLNYQRTFGSMMDGFENIL